MISGTSIPTQSKWAVSSSEFENVISSPVNVQPVSDLTIPEFLKQNLQKWNDAVAFECGVTGRKYTHGDIFSKSRRFAASLEREGLKRGDVGLTFLPNIIDFPIVAVGMWEAGLVLSPVNPSYTSTEVEKQMADCNGKVIVTIPELLPTLQAVKSNCPSLNTIILIGQHVEVEGCISFEEMLEADISGFNPTKATDINPMTETAILPYSSGTTGSPKGVELTHSNFTTNLVQMTHPDYWVTEQFEKGISQERYIGVLPFFHMYGLQVIMAMTLLQGAHTITVPKFHPATFIRAIKKHRPTVLHLVTPLISFINNCSEIGPEDLAETRAVRAGAAPIGRSLIDEILKKTGPHTNFIEGYGLTETSAISQVVPSVTEKEKIGSCGVLLPGTTCKIVDLTTGENVGTNQAGELCILGPQVMKGYYKNAEATKEAIGSDGFFRTGDVVYMDDDGFLYIVDRLKELIKVKGLQVAPAELENLLRLHPEIADVAVIGVKHEKLGEVPRAYIVPKTKNLTETSVTDFLEGKLAPYKKLVGGVEFIDAIPKSPAGKILRRRLLQQYQTKMEIEF